MANPLYPSMFPRASVHTHRQSACLALSAVRSRRPRRWTQRAASAIAASAARGCHPLLCVLRRWPAASHPQNPTSGQCEGECLPLSLCFPQYAVKPEQPVSWGVDRPLGPKGGEALWPGQSRETLSGSLQDMVPDLG